MSEFGNWCLIESDPGIFSEIIKDFGVANVQIEELYSLQDFHRVLDSPCYGLIFLFKYNNLHKDPIGSFLPNDHEIFFAHQKINNACATQALINLLMNIDDPSVKISGALGEYKDFAKDLDPETRGICLSNCEAIRAVHNSFARPNFYEIEQIGSSHGDENYHFVTYMPIGNKIVELDGLMKYPLKVATLEPGEDWMDKVRPVIQARMDRFRCASSFPTSTLRFTEGEIGFNILAAIPNRKAALEKEIIRMNTANLDGSLDETIQELHEKLADEEYKQAVYRKENIRRKFNYLPFLMELLKILAKEDKLVPLIEKEYNAAQFFDPMLTTEKILLDLKKK